MLSMGFYDGDQWSRYNDTYPPPIYFHKFGKPISRKTVRRPHQLSLGWAKNWITSLLVFCPVCALPYLSPYLKHPAPAFAFRNFVGFVLRKIFIASPYRFDIDDFPRPDDNNPANNPFFLAIFIPRLIWQFLSTQSIQYKSRNANQFWKFLYRGDCFWFSAKIANVLRIAPTKPTIFLFVLVIANQNIDAFIESQTIRFAAYTTNFVSFLKHV